MDSNLIVGLLTAAVILLSIVILALLAVIIVVLLKVKKIMNNVHQISGNVASMTAWLTPAKLFGQARDLFRRS